MEKRVNNLKLLTNGNTFIKLLPLVNRLNSRVKHATTEVKIAVMEGKHNGGTAKNANIKKS